MPKDYPNFESLISSFLSKLELATKSDVHSLMKRIDHLEELIESAAKNSGIQPIQTTKSSMSNPRISDQVLDILGKSDSSMTYAQLKEISGFDEKSLRNVIYRLNKLGRIKTVRRGHYKISNNQEKKSNDS
jgi:transcription initiation factor IIE alpha subunit